jgi:hypothetical protein
MIQPFPAPVRDVLASRVFRMHHYLWNELRDFWAFYSEDTRAGIRELGWEPPRPAINEDNSEIVDNGSGEDYLYLHCEMIAFANRLLAEAGDPGFPRIEGWASIPEPGDPAYPVPPAWFSPESFAVSNTFVTRVKFDDFFDRRFRYWERLCKDPVYLRDVPLAELGTAIDATLHDAVRSRWAAPPGAIRPQPSDSGEPISPAWDDPRYDFLRDAYAMHVNPIYWKFYGWVVDRVEDWKVANVVADQDFWGPTWIGKLPGGVQPSGRYPLEGTEEPALAVLTDAATAAAHLAEMEQVVAVIAEHEAVR